MILVFITIDFDFSRYSSTINSIIKRRDVLHIIWNINDHHNPKVSLFCWLISEYLTMSEITSASFMAHFCITLFCYYHHWFFLQFFSKNYNFELSDYRGYDFWPKRQFMPHTISITKKLKTTIALQSVLLMFSIYTLLTSNQNNG